MSQGPDTFNESVLWLSIDGILGLRKAMSFCIGVAHRWREDYLQTTVNHVGVYN